MNTYKHCMLGLEKAIEREIGDLFRNVCAGGGVGAQARSRLQTIKFSAVKVAQLIDEEERNANEISRAAQSHVRGSFWQGQSRNPEEGGEGIRGQRQTWEATEVRPQIESKEAIDQSHIDYKGSDP